MRTRGTTRGTVLGCDRCNDGVPVATQVIQRHRAGDPMGADGQPVYTAEVAGYCARHVVGQLVADLTRLPGAVKPPTADCETCGAAFYSGGTKTGCMGCYYSGRAHAARPRIADIIEGSRAETAVWHTGGGCFLLAFTLPDGRLITATVAVQGSDGTWGPEASLPDADAEGWWAGLHPDAAAYEDGEEPEAFGVAPMTDRELIRAVNRVMGVEAS